MASGDIALHQVTRVQVKSNWVDPWVTDTDLHCVRISETVTPSVSSADLIYYYGRIMAEGESSFSLLEGLANKFGVFVQVQFLDPPDSDPEVWTPMFTGWIQQEQIITHHPRTNTPHDDPTGDQVFTALGLEVLLDRIPLWHSWTEKQVQAPAPAQIDYIEHAIPFNQKFSHSINWQGNRSVVKYPDSIWGDQSAYVFTNGSHDAMWTGKDIIEYLMVFNDYGEVRWQLAGNVDVIDANVPEHFDAYKMTAANILNKFADRRRGVGWTVRVVEAGESDPIQTDIAQIFIFSTFADTIYLSDGGSVSGNAEPKTVDLDDRHDVYGTPLFAFDGLTQYDWITVRGARMRTMFSMTADEGTLIKGWTQAEEEAYGLSSDKARMEDDHKHVYAKFVTPDFWDWKAGINGLTAAPKIGNDGRLITDEYKGKTRNVGHRLLRQLPWQKPGFGTVPDYERPFVLMQWGDNEKYFYAETPGDRGPPVSFNLRMLDNDSGFIIEHSGPPHVMGKNHFPIPGQQPPATSETPAIMDWEKLVAVVAIECDQQLAVNVALLGGETLPINRMLLIDVPDAHLWFAVGGCVNGLDDDGDLLRWPASGILRDDSDKLRKIADIAAAWYAVARTAVTVELDSIEDEYEIGNLLTVTTGSISETAGSVVTERIFDLEQFRTTIKTSFERPDFAAF